MRTIRCKCACITGARCTWKGTDAETVLVEYIPEHARAKYRLEPELLDTPGIWSVARCARACAEELREFDPAFIRMAMAY